ncbi:hypothetical protein HK096_010279 [Nowakowskiella sp. JEL0078]|nr:hypothetical protein HK096_010279 [Nowakowskiella sp. JEL0078]
MAAARMSQPKHETARLDGKVYIVTGGHSGLGLHTTLQLVSRGSTVLIGARNTSKADAAITKLAQEHPDLSEQLKNNIRFFQLDLSTIETARQGAENVIAITKRLDGLVNNAASNDVEPYKIGPNGLEQYVALNHIGTYIFTMGLLDLLKKTSKLPDSDVRIVIVSSEAHRFAPKDLRITTPADYNKPFSNPNASFNDNLNRYGGSKVYAIVWMADLQEQLVNEGYGNILAICVHPGSVATEKIFGAFAKIPGGQLIVKALFIQPSMGAWNSLFAVASPQVRKEEANYRGAYLVPFGKKVLPSELARNRQFREDVIRTTQEVIKNGGWHSSGEV